ncbi:MAG: Maf family nucleotide pyrophosphatase [Bacteroidales bacterium]
MFNLNDILTKKIILASKSPRRFQLIQQMGFDVEISNIDVEEDYPQDMQFDKIAEFLALKKANAFINPLKDNQILITADTMVFVNEQSIGKPENKEMAVSYLQSLSNKEHKVITGCCLKTKTKTHSFSVCTNVFFRELTLQEIEYYIENYKPFDKAGAYGIQEWIGSIGIERIEGCFYNVMGLPTTELFKEIKSICSDNN